MAELPKTLDDAIAQAREAVKVALSEGKTRLQVELLFPEISLQAQSIAQQFLPEFEELGPALKVFFPDTGAAALARHKWGQVAFKISDLGSSRSPIENKIEEEDRCFLVVDASSVEVDQVEQLCKIAGDRPVILLLPTLEDAAGVVGIGLAGRQRRERFLNTLFSCYYLRPLDGAALFRCHPQSWQIWLEEAPEEYKLLLETSQKPVGDELDRILNQATATTNPDSPQPSQPVRKKGFLAELQTFIKALTK